MGKKLNGSCLIQEFDKATNVRNLPEPRNEDTEQTDHDLVRALGNDEHGNSVYSQVSIKGAARLPNRSPKPALLKIAFSSLNEKKLVLFHKFNLKDTPYYKRVFVRTSKPHGERVQEHNCKIMLQHTDLGNHYRMASSGKLIPLRQDHPRPTNVKSRNELPPPPREPYFGHGTPTQDTRLDGSQNPMYSIPSRISELSNIPPVGSPNSHGHMNSFQSNRPYAANGHD